jgi:vacuolar-type H+-ATPase subunit I/STV1
MSVFSSSKSLDNHQKIAKYCLSIQGKQNDRHKCLGCQKIVSSNDRLVKHYPTCIDYQLTIKCGELLQEKKDLEKETKELEKRIILLEKMNEKLEDTISQKDKIIADLAEKAITSAKPNITHTTNNTVNNVSNLNIISQEHLHEQAQHLTIEHIKKGAVGYSEYFLEYPLKERVACTDYSRRKIKYKNENGEIITDPEMSTLSDLLFKSIKDRNRELTVQYTNELTDKFKTAKDPTQLAYFMEVAGKFSDQDIEVFKMFNGNKNEFFHDILRNICSKTLLQ